MIFKLQIQFQFRMKIVSFLPSATEILYELGVQDQLKAVTHECNYPVQARSKPQVIHSSFDPKIMSSQEIDNKVIKLSQTGQDIYILDEKVLKNADPDIIISQGICEVCSPHTREIERAVTLLGRRPDIITLDPKNLDDILQNVIQIGIKVQRQEKAKELVSKLQKRINFIQQSPISSKPKVLCIEWLDPLYTAGHWIPQMVDIAGGTNGISSVGEKSRKMTLDEIEKFDPDVIILMPCGFALSRIISEYETLLEDMNWRSLKAVRQGQVYAVNANEYFSKPGPRTVTGLEILAKIIHPDTHRNLQIPEDSIQRIEE